MKAIILAAGRGTRMQPLSDHTPKPLLKVGGKPLIIWHIEKLQKAGFQDIVINIAWLAEQIPQALGDGSQFGVNLTYSDESKDGALETAGGILKALPLLGDKPFLVISSDVWCDIHYSNKNPITGDNLAHLILVNNPPHHLEGDFSLLENKQLGVNGQIKFTFSGVGYYHPKFFQNLPQGKLAIAPVLRKAMQKEQVSGELYTGDWRDIGTPDRLSELDRLLSK